MDISVLLFELSVGELSSLAMSNGGDGTIRPADMNKVIVALNSSLRDLYAKFYPVTEQELITVMGQHLYPLPISCKNVLSVATEDGRMLPINDEEHDNSVYLVNQDSIRIPQMPDGTVLTVTYQPKPPTVRANNLDTKLGISDELITPLKLLTASTIFNNIGSADAVQRGASLAQQYQYACVQLEANDHLNRSRFMNHRFDKGGWI